MSDLIRILKIGSEAASKEGFIAYGEAMNAARIEIERLRYELSQRETSISILHAEADRLSKYLNKLEQRIDELERSNLN